MDNFLRPRYESDADYTTNAPSYYDDLARKNELLKILAKRIWEYDKTLDNSLEKIDKALENVMNKIGEGFNEEIETLLVKWVNDGTLENIINHEIFNTKLDTDIYNDEMKSLLTLKRSALLNSDFDKVPYVRNVTGDFGFSVENNTFKVTTTSGGSFALLLSEYVVPNQKIYGKIVTMTETDNVNLTVYMNGMTEKTTIDLGLKNQWNANYFEMTQNDTIGYDYLYFEVSENITFKEINISIAEENTFDEVPQTFAEVNERISQPNNKYHNSKGAIEALINVGMTYEKNKANLVYGNGKTGIDRVTTQVNGKWEVDCSSFASMVLQGITFENSKYNGKEENIKNPLFFKDLDTDKYRYANQLAHFAAKNGYAFKPEKDFSNVEAGDVIFFSWDDFPTSDFRERGFMQVDHVGIFLNKRESTTKPLYDFLQYYEGNTSSAFYTSTQKYVDQAIMVARFPLANMESLNDNENMIVEGNKKRTKKDVGGFGGLKLTKSMEYGKYYTVIMKATFVKPSYLIFGDYNYKSFYHTWDETPNNEGVYIFRFPYLNSTVSDLLTISVTSQTTLEGAWIDWVMMFEGFNSISNRYIETPLNTAITSVTFEEGLPSLDPLLKPSNKVSKNGNVVTLAINIPFTEFQQGHSILGKIPSNFAPREDVNIPAFFRDGYDQKSTMFGYVQIWTNGQLNLRPYASEIEYKEVIINGSYFL